jgi:hypothetical protein
MDLALQKPRIPTHKGDIHASHPYPVNGGQETRVFGGEEAVLI